MRSVLKKQLQSKKPQIDKIKQHLKILGQPASAERVVRWFYESLGFSMKGITFESHPRKSLSDGGVHYQLKFGDMRVLINPRWTGSEHYLKMLVHEVGHAAYHTSIHENLYAYHERENGWADEVLADLFVVLFFEREVLKHSPISELNEIGKTDSRILRYVTTSATSFVDLLPEYRFQALAIKNSDLSPEKLAALFFKEWPDYFFNHLDIPGLTEEQRRLFFSVRQLHWLISYPLNQRAYVEGSMVCAAIVANQFKQGTASWQKITDFGLHLRHVFSPGGKISDEILFQKLGVNVKDRASLLSNFKKYFDL